MGVESFSSRVEIFSFPFFPPPLMAEKNSYRCYFSSQDNCLFSLLLCGFLPTPKLFFLLEAKEWERENREGKFLVFIVFTMQFAFIQC
jgi:hypothetical protein